MFISLELFTKRIKQENKYKKCYKIVTNGLTNSRGIFIIGHMNRLRDSAIVLGLAGMLLMVSADTKDVEAKISYESESIDRSTEDDTAGVLRGIGTELLGAVAENRVDSGRMRQTYAQTDWSEEEEQQKTVSDIENEVEEMEEEIDQTVVSEEETAETEPVSEGALYFVNPTLADAGNLKWFREHLTLLFAYHGHEFYL